MRSALKLALFTSVAVQCGFAHERIAANADAFVWSFEPGIVAPLVLAGVLFGFGASRRRHRTGWSWPQLSAFVAGWLMLVVALVSPVHKLGAQLFWVHMTQHELLVIVAAPLLVLSRPLQWFIWALPMRAREAVGRWTKAPRFAALWRAMTAPLFVWLLHGATLWLWHIPAAYQASVENESVHAAQHAMFLGSALLFWWSLVHGRQGRLGYGMAVIYCFTTAVHTSVLGALMAFAQHVWYPIYDGRTAAFHLTALEDQQLGGLIMWVPAGVVFVVLGLWLLAAWIRESERRVQFTRAAEIAATRTLLLLCCAAVLLVACDPARPNYVAEVRRLTGGDPRAGHEKIRRYGCHACHTIPGVAGADALVGPPLIHWSRRVYIAGELPNTPQNLQLWLQHPPQVEGRTAMPDMGVSEQDARDIAAYLYTLR